MKLYKKFIPMTILACSLQYFTSCNSLPRELETDNQRIMREVGKRYTIPNAKIRLRKKIGSVECKLMKGKDSYTNKRTRPLDSVGYIGCQKHF